MAKSRNNKFIDTIDECLTSGIKNGIFQVSLENNSLNGRTVTIGGKEVVNFGSCSYLGLEVDERLKQGAIDATKRFGTQYSSSRLFSSCNLYEEVEDLFYKIFDNNPAILAATTTLTHISAIPILIQDDDLVILDHQVHGSVQLAVQLVKARGTRVEMIKHNSLDMLEDLIRNNANKHHKIWYMADGLYSMYGDYAPLKDIVSLMEKYPSLHLYIDDAHGMSWSGKHGNGYVLSQIPMHPKMVLSTSLAKGFGTGGGVLVLSDKEMRRKILTCGSSYTFSGPVQPPMLGASIASAKIHLTDEIYLLQDKLKGKLELTQMLIRQLNLPLVLPSNSPIFYIGLGLPRVGYNMVRRLLKEGFYTNIGIFPGVPVKCSGLRLAITNGQTDEDIKNVLDAFTYHLPRVLEEEGQTIDDISANFNLPFEDSKKHFKNAPKNIRAKTLQIQHVQTIKDIDKVLWDELLGDNGTFDWDGCSFLEETFSKNAEPENNWNFHYLIIRDETLKPILATFFSELLCKDDMIAPASISQQVEEIRKKDPYYLTSKVIMMGSLLSEGNHLYLNKESPEWQGALLEMIRIMNEVKEKCGATIIQLRDFDSEDTELRDFLIKEGFIKLEMPDTHVFEDFTWDNEQTFIDHLSPKSRLHVRKQILPFHDAFSVNYISDSANTAAIETIYKLYLAVKQQSYNINTFHLPLKFFQNALLHPKWEIMELSIGGEINSFGLCYRSDHNYIPMVIGLNYSLNKRYNCYRQNMYRVIQRGKELGVSKIYFGMDASFEKTRLGARSQKKSVYLQIQDNYQLDLLSLLTNNK
jgi:7-keto-8-aminopelargonate synthetase-like enzyme/predicted N-acyltransferase